jgi:hypothetical protein
VNIPECPKYIAHPQSVWFHEHWLPIIKKLAEIIVEQERCLDAIDDHFRELRAHGIIDMKQMIHSLKILSASDTKAKAMLKELSK